MTTTFAPFGLRPARKKGSNYNAEGANRYLIANSYNTNIGFGDLVGLAATGGTIQLVSTSTEFAQGVFLGCKFVDPTTRQPRWSKFFPAGTSSADGVIEAMVNDDPDTIFAIQADASVSQGDVGRNFGVSHGSVNTFTGMSSYALKPATRTAGSALLRVVDVVNAPNNSFSGTDPFPVVLVQIIQHQANRTSVS